MTTPKLKPWQRKAEQTAAYYVLLGFVVGMLAFIVIVSAILPAEQAENPYAQDVAHRHQVDEPGLFILSQNTGPDFNQVYSAVPDAMEVNHKLTTEIYVAAGKGVVVMHTDTGNVEFRGECDLNLAAWKFWALVAKGFDDWKDNQPGGIRK